MAKNSAPAPHPPRGQPVDVRGWLGGIRLSGFMVIMLGLVVLAAFVLVPAIWSHALVNPVVVGLGPILDSAAFRQVSEIVAREPDARWGEAVVAVVVPANGAQLSHEAVCALLDGRVARYKYPRDVVFADTLPRTALGKVKREDLKRLARHESAAGAA